MTGNMLIHTSSSWFVRWFSNKTVRSYWSLRTGTVNAYA